MELLRKYPLTAAALVLWLLFMLIFDHGSLLLGLAIGVFLFEQGIAPGLADQVKRLAKLDQ